MSELGFVAYGWYVPDPAKAPSFPGQRLTISYSLLHFHSAVTPDLFEISDESKLMIPWRSTEAEVQRLHPEHRKIFWDGGTVEMFRGKDCVLPQHHVLLTRGQSHVFEGLEVAATWRDTLDEIEDVLKRALSKRPLRLPQ